MRGGQGRGYDDDYSRSASDYGRSSDDYSRMGGQTGGQYGGQYGGQSRGGYGSYGSGGGMAGGMGTNYGTSFDDGMMSRGSQDYGQDYRRDDYSRGVGSRSIAGMSGYAGGMSQGERSGDGWTKTYHAGKGPKGYSRSDDRVREDVSDRLSDDPSVDASNIEVSVSNGEVTLSGTVDRREDKRRAEDCAESVSGVNHVQNNLRVGSGSGSSGSGSSAASGSGSGSTGTSSTDTYGSTTSGSGSTMTGSTSGSTAGSTGGSMSSDSSSSSGKSR